MAVPQRGNQSHLSAHQGHLGIHGHDYGSIKKNLLQQQQQPFPACEIGILQLLYGGRYMLLRLPSSFCSGVTKVHSHGGRIAHYTALPVEFMSCYRGIVHCSYADGNLG